jgi:hypothetical protein
MKHMDDQDLLLLSHGALGPLRSLAAQMHLRRCADCRQRYGGLCTVSVAVATALRVGLPAWKPTIAGVVKLLVGVTVVAIGVLYAEIVVVNHNPYDISGSVKGQEGTSQKNLFPTSAYPNKSSDPVLQRVKFTD